MMNQAHTDVIERLSEYLDGTLEAAEHDETEAHLGACAACRSVLEELRAVVAGAAALGDVEPERDLWPGIAAAIAAPVRARPLRGAGDVIELPTARSSERPRRAGVFLSLPQLAAASIALAVVTAALTWSVAPWSAVTDGGPVAGPVPSGSAVQASSPLSEVASPELAEELAALEGALSAVRGRLEPNTVRILEKNLGVIERAIEESLLALEQDPANEFVRAHLERQYREKADYLREATRLAEWAS